MTDESKEQGYDFKKIFGDGGPTVRLAGEVDEEFKHMLETLENSMIGLLDDRMQLTVPISVEDGTRLAQDGRISILDEAVRNLYGALPSRVRDEFTDLFESVDLNSIESIEDLCDAVSRAIAEKTPTQREALDEFKKLLAELDDEDLKLGQAGFQSVPFIGTSVDAHRCCELVGSAVHLIGAGMQMRLAQENGWVVDEDEIHPPERLKHLYRSIPIFGSQSPRPSLEDVKLMIEILEDVQMNLEAELVEEGHSSGSQDVSQ